MINNSGEVVDHLAQKTSHHAELAPISAVIAAEG
ncbi:hypothetical protein OOU_Y34scaffold00279g3 [Pyricularia oryzae Y34]|uniref:Uncharacterized protein n=2 Tax=Pyricularia oryzae TaxID=318829 RepID=A0AA97PP10_PYRO3|nr:hypothetical protein OOU_Y34scaffold00279g3 [Pyricularia oryzae Y34]